MQFLLDENVPVTIGLFLQAQNLDVLIVRQSDLAGSDDTVIWKRACKDHRVIITQDLDFPLENVSGFPAGLIILRPRDQRPAMLLKLFQQAWRQLKLADLREAIVVIEPGRIRRRQYP